MKRPALVWAVGVLSLAGLDFWCDRNTVPGDTLSECTRVLFRTHTPLGRLVFLAFWTRLYVWYARHICKEIANG